MRTYEMYEATIDEAKGLLAEQIRDPVGEANPEYTRGIVELIASTFGYHGDVSMDGAKQRVLHDIGLPQDYV